ncbi:hypothetical protein BRD16_06785 [Halobacteriales archaeon SW_6_65_46]|nr:MAG: hypothetical protein BRD16_06785 [Halobacteriales archaeon SW_6_65_46]
MDNDKSSSKSIGAKFSEWNQNPSKYPKRTGGMMGLVIFVIVAIGDFLITQQRFGIAIEYSVISAVVLGLVCAAVGYVVGQSAITGGQSGGRGGNI